MDKNVNMQIESVSSSDNDNEDDDHGKLEPEETRKIEMRNKHNLKLFIPKPDETVPSEIRTADAAKAGTSLPSGTNFAVKFSKRELRRERFARSKSMPGPANDPTISTLERQTTIAATQPTTRERKISRQSSLLQRTAVLRRGSRRVKEATQTLVGIGKNSDKDHEKWRIRHMRYCSQRYGRLKPQHETECDEQSFSQSTSPSLPHILDPYARAYGSRFYHSTIGTPDDADYQPSFGGAMTPPPRTPATPGNRSLASGRFGASVGPARVPISRLRKDSVARMSWKVLSAVVKGQGVMNNLIVSQHHMGGQADKRSFQRTSLDEGDETCHEADASFFTQEMPTIVEGESLQDEVFFDHVTAEDARRTPTLKQVQGRKRGQKIGVERVLSTALHREKREFGRGLVGALLNRRLRRQRLDSNVKRQIDTFDNHRPYFTYWITFVHIVITIISIVVYGVAPVGFTYVEEKFTTMKYSRSRVRETFREPQNFWIGPRTKDLIRLGAKYSPCMRLDRKLGEWIAKERNIERNSSCCVRSDNSGCIQTADKCGPWFNEFNKWDGRNQDAAKFNSTRLRTSGSVCGQDPRFCGSQQDAAGTPNEWPDDITKWPICKNPINDTAVDHRDGSFPHMRCTIVGHPCCIGQEASCQIVAEEYCKKKHGIYHPDAFLCSQVNCMQDTCGLIPFRDPERPDQLYRLWLPILLHAGVLHCLVSVLFQMTVVRDMEKLAGWLRISIIYMLSGVAGNLGSAIFLPYRAEVGPAGSHFGILACLFVEVFQTWQLLRSPSRALFKLVTIAVVLFLIGCLPWIDNFAHIFGFLSGFLLSFVFLPYITFNRFDARRKRIQVFTCFFMFVGLFALLVFFFYISPITDCEPCKYLNCAFAENFCSNHGFKPGDRGD